MPNHSIVVEGKKLIWDGVVYGSGNDAARNMEAYRNDGFDVEVLEDHGEVFLYTRRIVKEAIL